MNAPSSIVTHAIHDLATAASEARDLLGGLYGPFPGGERWTLAYHTALRVEALADRLRNHHTDRQPLVEMPDHGTFPIREDGPLSLAELYLLLRDAQDLQRIFIREGLAAGDEDNYGATVFRYAVFIAGAHDAVVPTV